MNYFLIIFSFCLLPTAFSKFIKRTNSEIYDLGPLNNNNNENQNSTEIKPLFEDGKMNLEATDKKRRSIRDFVNNEIVPRFSFKSSRRSFSSSSTDSRKSNDSQRSSRSSSGNLSITSDDSPKERLASSDFSRPKFLNTFLALNSVDAINWDELTDNLSLSLPEDLESLLNKYFRNENYRNNEPFKSKVRKAMAFISNDFQSNPFILNLAIKLVQMYDTKAPNALKLFLESRFAFMKTVPWDQNTFTKNLEVQVKGSPGHSSQLFQDPTFLEHLETLFLDMFTNYPNSLYDTADRTNRMFMMFMELFYNTNTASDFYRRYAYFIKILLKTAVAPVNNDRVENAFTYRFDDIQAEISSLFD